MSTLKADAVTTKSDNTDLTITGGGTGVPNLEAGFKVGGSAGVPTASIQDDAVTLAKLAAGTDGELITWDASGDPAAVAVGTATHVLTSNGAGAAPTFQAAGGGAWTLIGTSVASTSASLTVTGLNSTYDTYGIALSDLIPADDIVKPWIRFGDSGGIDSGASDYVWANQYIPVFDLSAHGRVVDNADSEIELTSLSMGNDTGEGLNAMCYLLTPGDSTSVSSIFGSSAGKDSGGDQNPSSFWGYRATVITLDRVQFLFSAGNITAGRMTVWGISHA